MKVIHFSAKSHVDAGFIDIQFIGRKGCVVNEKPLTVRKYK